MNEKLLWSEKLPVFDNGEITFASCGDDSIIMCAKETSIDDFKAYCNRIEAFGFEKKDSRIAGEALFETFSNSEEYVYAYYCPRLRTSRVVNGPVGFLGLKDCGSYEEKYSPKLLMIGQTEYMNCGQGYIFLLPDGRVLVQDGGDLYKDRNDYMYKAMRELVPEGEKLVVAAWFHSHPHGDHQFGYEEFIENHGSDADVVVERVVVNYACAEMYTYMRRDNQYEDCGRLVDAIHEKTAKYIPTAKFIKAHTGQVFNFGSVDAEILFTVEDYLPVDQFDYVNSTSLVVRISYQGQSVLLLADTTHVSGRILENTFGDYLKSDMVQLPHHGMWASNVSLYSFIKASVVLWPNIEKVAKEWLGDKAVVAALERATDLYVSGTGLKTVSFPYKHVNNKEQVIDELKKL